MTDDTVRDVGDPNPHVPSDCQPGVFTVHNAQPSTATTSMSVGTTSAHQAERSPRRIVVEIDAAKVPFGRYSADHADELRALGAILVLANILAVLVLCVVVVWHG